MAISDIPTAPINRTALLLNKESEQSMVYDDNKSVVDNVEDNLDRFDTFKCKHSIQTAI